MKKMNSLHIEIANVLIDCASRRKTICYEELCNRVHYPSPHAIGRELGKLSEFTYDKYGIFISVLVVMKETQGTDNPMPSSGFFTMYGEKCGKPDGGIDIVQEQREKAFEQDWGNLIDDIRASIKS